MYVEFVFGLARGKKLKQSTRVHRPAGTRETDNNYLFHFVPMYRVAMPKVSGKNSTRDIPTDRISSASFS